ncbi:hypothetical protein [Arthrobacter castelli]|uniref:hypothetical protein n=1 Tax=Arthrobacter castelli TaxID=271431 RepID=UPI00138B0E35|nr:hypothetical protein [Arthrobacter castelli]
MAALVLRAAFIRPGGGMRFLIPWSLVIVVAMLGELVPPAKHARWGGGGLLAGLDNLLLPLAVMLTIWCCIAPSSAASLLRTGGKLYVWCMTANATLAIVDTGYDLSTFLRPFWSREGDMTTVAARAEAMGRLSGIINQPSSAGLAYSLAGLLAIYLYTRTPRKLYPILTLVTIGGLLTVSKVFILIGIPLMLLYLLKSSTGSRKAGILFAFLVATGAILQTGLFQGWKGLDFLTRLLSPPDDQSLIGFYTAGRWVEDSPMMTVIMEALRVSPLTGVGAGGWDVAYDSSWAQTIVVSGLLGIVGLAAVLVGFFRLAKLTLNPERKRFTLFLAAMLCAASFGLPALTTNRIGVIVWTITALLVLAHRQGPEGRQTWITPGADRSELLLERPLGSATGRPVVLRRTDTHPAGPAKPARLGGLVRGKGAPFRERGLFRPLRSRVSSQILAGP